MSNASLKYILPLLATFSISSFALPAYAGYECNPPKSNYSEVSCTNDVNYFVAYDKNYNLQGLLNKQGTLILNPKGYDSIDFWNISDGVFAVSKNDKVGYMNTQGKLVVPVIYDNLIDPDDKYDETWANPVSGGRIIVEKNGKIGIIDTSNRVIMPFTSKYRIVESFNEGLAPVMSKSGKWGFINQSGKEVIPTKYERIAGSFGGAYGFSQGLAGMYDGKKWGYITKTGKVAIPFIYDEIRPFSENLAGVLKNGKWGFIDGANRTVVPFKYSDENVERLGVNYLGATYFVFNDGVAEVASINDNIQCINKSGKTVTCR